VNSLQFGDGNGWVNIGPLQTVALSSIQINTSTLYGGTGNFGYVSTSFATVSSIVFLDPYLGTPNYLAVSSGVLLLNGTLISGSGGVGTGYDQNGMDVAVRCFVAIDDDALYDDELFIRYCLAKAKISLSRVLSAFNYNLPGGVTVNTGELRSDGEKELQEVMDMINGENTPSYFLQWN
jgi:hypothetical protein